MSLVSNSVESCRTGAEIDVGLSNATESIISSINVQQMNLESDGTGSTESKRTAPETAAEDYSDKKDTARPETIKEKKDSEHILDLAMPPKVADSYLTLTGTIKRSKKSGQKETDVQITIRKEDLMEMKSNQEISKSHETNATSKICSAIQGTSTLILTILCIPFVFIVSSLYSFYIGTITWHNVFSVYSEEENLFYRITVSPLLMLIYPLYIVFCTLCVGVYSAFVQVRCDLSQWLKEIQDLEKGFYGWLCRALSVEDCCPYELVILTQVRQSLPEQV